MLSKAVKKVAKKATKKAAKRKAISIQHQFAVVRHHHRHLAAVELIQHLRLRTTVVASGNQF